MEARHARARIHNWRRRLLEDDRHTYQWLRRQPPQRTPHITTTTPNSETDTLQTPTTETTQQALDCITTYWNQIWQRTTPHLADATATTTAQLGPQRPPMQWEPLTTKDITTAANKQHGKTHGMDGWSGNDLKLIPPQAWPGITNIINALEQSGTPPRAWREIRQCHKPKESSLHHVAGTSTTTAHKLRPLSVASVWYRLWAAARYHHTTTTTWINNWQHPATYGARKHITANMAAKAIIDTSQNRCTATLDLTQAFDHVTPAIAINTLKHLGVCPTTSTFIANIWEHQLRYLTYDHHFNQRPIHVSTSIPQGDSWSMLALTACMQTALHHITTTWPATQQALFVDDRTWTSPTTTELQQVNAYWHNYTASIGIPENTSKAQYWTDGDQSRRQNLPQAMGYDYDPTTHDHITFLGTTLTLDTPDQHYTENIIQPRRRVRQRQRPNYSLTSQHPHPPTHMTHPPGGARTKHNQQSDQHHPPANSANADHRQRARRRQQLPPSTDERATTAGKGAPNRHTTRPHSQRQQPQQHRPKQLPTSTAKATTTKQIPPRNNRKRKHELIRTARDHNDLHPKEASRLQSTLQTLYKIQRLPHTWRGKARFTATAARPKASYGWQHHLPPANYCRRLRVDTFKALGTPTTCDRSLTQLFTGHNTDIAFMAGYNMATAHYKIHIQRDQPTATPHHQPPTHTDTVLGQWLNNQGWQPCSPNTTAWQHNITNDVIPGPPHHEHHQSLPHLHHVQYNTNDTQKLPTQTT